MRSPSGSLGAGDEFRSGAFGRPPFSLREFSERYALLAMTVGLALLCIITIPQFRSVNVFATMINTQSIILFLALTATIVLRTGGFDLSIPQTMVGSATIVAVLSSHGIVPILAALVGLIFGLIVGAVNAVLIVHIGVDSFVATLASFTAVAGLSLLISGSRLVVGVPDVIVGFSRSSFLGIPLVTWYAWLLVVILWFVYQRTPLGRQMLFIGGNQSAARLAGVRVQVLRSGAYLTSGILAAFIGIVYAGYFGSVDPSIGGQYMLQPFAAAFLGATAITIGRFNAVGTIIALYLLTTGITGLQMLGAQAWVTNVFYGVALMAAVTASKLVGRTPRAKL